MIDDVLTEEKIKALLSSLQQEEVAYTDQNHNKRVQSYDFKKAIRFSQEQIRTLTRIHESFARLLTTYFSTKLRTYVNIAVDSVEQYPYDEFLTTVQKDAVFGVFKAPPLQGNMVMEFSTHLLNVMLDRLFGGQGENSAINNDFTEIEISIIRREFTEVLNHFKEAWSSVLEISPDLSEIEMNPQFLTVTAPNETVILATLEMKIGEVTGKITICLPHVVLEQVLPKLSARHWLANQKKATDRSEVQAIETQLKTTKIDVRAILGKSNIEIGDFLTLNKGDVIRLDKFVDEPITILVDENPKFYGQPGLSKGRTAVQVTTVLRESDELDDK